ncbi:hypothetical protein H6F75_26365 [Nodosilinea sp. FACHB-131]|uniref:hypothetical protein n=1 Tax=Cyanophyceae TaxID=3028117 RepID=UPI0016880E01|nr:hypothetical protein [Nodosilinea sp. FACHB-131]MBD1877014.1 hypothetical protein [Nodosilinea sp. FACHB-131]
MKLPFSLPLLLLLATPLLAAQGHVYRDSDGAISVYKLEPNAQVQIGIDTSPSRNLISNRCGLLVVTSSANYLTATVQVDGAVINPANLQTRIRPNCRPKSDGSYALDEERPNHFKTSNGDLVIVGKQPETRYTVSYPGQLRILTRRVNACGILRVRETNTINFNQSILLPTTSASTYAEFQIDQIPLTTPLECYRNDLYLPQPWTDIFAEAIAGSEIAAAVVQAARSIPSAIASGVSGSGGEGGSSGGSGSGGVSSGGSSGGGTSGGDLGGSSGSGGGSSGPGNGSGSSGDGTEGTSGGDPGENSGGGSGGNSGGSGGSTGSPSMTDFTLATYNPTIHDFNSDGLVDDATGNGVPDDRDNDGFPDGPWEPNDFPKSAGPGFTIPINASLCYGYNGNLVASSWSFTRGLTYYLTADDGLGRAASQNPLPGTAGGSTSGPPTVRFEGDFRASNFSHTFEDSNRGGHIASDDEFNDIMFHFYWAEEPSCLMPPWMLNPPNGIAF